MPSNSPFSRSLPFNFQVSISFFEIYGGRCQDLLNNRNRLNVREDGGGEVIVSDLEELQAESVQDMLDIIGNHQFIIFVCATRCYSLTRPLI